MNKTTKILLGFATGALAGIITGLLLAPDKKSEKTKRSKDCKENGEEDLPPFFQKAKEKFDWAQKEK